ncbi:MLX-interacting protein isoform X2 [Cimex lectularius]|uniref:BHLH domain-containing protein n=1 Tax=Cimex lectularius TaxID=79782 RepID=A0A8I6RJN3_CIMLE|nr:MLX-interacting protein isoform X2 [Cimex lectularius]
MTIMAQKLDQKQKWAIPKFQTKGREAIHSGHFMVSDFEAEAQDDEDELAVPVPEVEKEVVEVKSVTANCPSKDRTVVSVPINSVKLPFNQLLIETSLTKLFQCMSLAYRQKLTSPKWNRFKGIRLRWKDKIRLNNVIWRCWHMQFIKKQNTLVCQFASPLDVDTHNKPEAIVLEGKYWKRKLNAVTAEYKKWRMYSRNQILGRPPNYGHDTLAELEGHDWSLNSNESLMMVDEDYMGLMSDTLFSTITANQPFAFPDTREIARGANLADFIQPSLVQLQPNLEEFMDIEPLHELFCSKLVSVPEETQTLQITQFSEEKQILSQQPAPPPDYPTTSIPPYPPPYPTQSLWYGLPDYNDPTVQQSIPQQALPSQNLEPHTYTQQPTQSSPPLTDLIVTRKEDIYLQPKAKSKWSGKPDQAKKLATTLNNSAALALIPSNSGIVLTPLAPGPAIPTQNISLQETQQNNNAFLAQLLTNSTPANYGFVGNEQTNSPTKSLPPKEEISYASQQSIGNIITLPFKTENEYSKQRSYKINQNMGSSTSPTLQTVQTVVASPMLIKSIQTPMHNVICGSSTSVCPESPNTGEALSLSPISVGSPTSPSTSNKPAPAYREHRRVCHINAEQKRRCNIKNGFDTLHSLIPHLNQNPNTKMSKAVMLQKGAEYIRQLQMERNELEKEMESLKQQIETLNAEICNCQSMLPATGAPISKHRSNKMRDMYRKYVRSRTHENWKFWILSLICEPLLESFNNNVATSSLDDLYRTTLQWINQHCSLVNLRPVVLNAFRHLSTTTEVLKDPARLPNEAILAVDRAVKKS